MGNYYTPVKKKMSIENNHSRVTYVGCALHTTTKITGSTNLPFHFGSRFGPCILVIGGIILMTLLSIPYPSKNSEPLPASLNPSFLSFLVLRPRISCIPGKPSIVAMTLKSLSLSKAMRENRPQAVVFLSKTLEWMFHLS